MSERTLRITVADKDNWDDGTMRYELQGVVCPEQLSNVPDKVNDMIYKTWAISVQAHVRAYCRKHKDSLSDVQQALAKKNVKYDKIVTYTGDFPKAAKAVKAVKDLLGALIVKVREGTASEDETAKVKAYFETHKDIIEMFK